MICLIEEKLQNDLGSNEIRHFGFLRFVLFRFTHTLFFLCLPPAFFSCSVFLLDRVSHELVAKVFDGGVVSDEEV